MPYKDPEDARAWRKAHQAELVAYSREWRRRNRERSNARQTSYRVRNRAILAAAKALPCADCGKQYPPYVMDFDHVRGTKVEALALLAQHSSEARLREEIAKCEVVCANCHRERTYQRKERQ